MSRPGCCSTTRPTRAELRLLEQLPVLAVPLGLEVRGRDEPHRRGVHAVAKPGWTGPVVEYVTEVRIAVHRSDFRPHHPELPIGFRRNILRLERPREARPAGAGIVLVELAEQRLAAHDV